MRHFPSSNTWSCKVDHILKLPWGCFQKHAEFVIWENAANKERVIAPVRSASPSVSWRLCSKSRSCANSSAEFLAQRIDKRRPKCTVFVASCQPSALLKLQIPALGILGMPALSCNIWRQNLGVAAFGSHRWKPGLWRVHSSDLKCPSATWIETKWNRTVFNYTCSTSDSLISLSFLYSISIQKKSYCPNQVKQQTRTPVQAMQWMPGWMPRLFVDLLLQRRATA